MPSAMSGGTCANATLEVAVSMNSATTKKREYMMIPPLIWPGTTAPGTLSCAPIDSNSHQQLGRDGMSGSGPQAKSGHVRLCAAAEGEADILGTLNQRLAKNDVGVTLGPPFK